MTGEFKIGEWSYRAEKLDAFQQCDVAALLLPVLSGAGDLLVRILKDARRNEDGTPRASLADILDMGVADAVGPLSKALAAMPREDRHFVLSTCLSRVSRIQQGGALAPVAAPNGQITFPDIRDDMTVMLRLVWKVVEHSLLSFSSGPTAASS